MTNFGANTTAEEVLQGLDLKGKNFVITGINSGLGQESARVLGGQGATIIGAARTEDKAAQTLASLGLSGSPLACDLSEPASVRAAVQTVQALGRPLDGILCNAGIMALPSLQQKHGLELQFLTNHLGHFLLVTGLLGSLGSEGRVVMVSSGAHRMAPDCGVDLDDLGGEGCYEPWRQYGQSKLANALFARTLGKRFEGSRQVAASLHPGVIKTALGRNNTGDTQAFYDSMDPALLKSIPQGAATEVLLIAHPAGAAATGNYWSDCQPAKASALAQDDALAEALWRKSEALAAAIS